MILKLIKYGRKNALKYFIGHNDNDAIRPLYIRLSQMTRYIDRFKDKKTKITTTAMSLMVKDKQLLKNYDKIWEKIERLMGINFDNKHFYGNDDNKY